MLKSTTLRPGLLVSLSTTIKGGNVRYTKRTIDAARTVEDGAIHEAWQTDKLVRNPAELEAGAVARGKARQEIIRLCSWSTFGLLCPKANRAELESAITKAREIADAFNDTAVDSRLYVGVLTGEIVDNDAQAIAMINEEMRDLMSAMESGVANLDAKAIRDAASRAVGLGQMLTPEAETRMRVAVDAARKAARTITKAGESAAQEVDRVALRRIQESRLAFLDMEDAQEMQAPQATAHAIDFDAPDIGNGDPDSPFIDATKLTSAIRQAQPDIDMDDDGLPPSPMLTAALAQVALEF